MKCIAVVRVRGMFSNPPKVRKTTECLRLARVNSCALVSDSGPYMGMLREIKDYVAFGEVSKETVAALLYKRGKKDGKKLNESAKKEEIEKMAAQVHANPSELAKLGVVPVFFLSPPKGGYGEAKWAYPVGALGKRPDMDKLLKSMLRI